MGRRAASSLGVLAAVAMLLAAGCILTSTPSPSPSPPSPISSPTENAQEREERIAYEQAEFTLRAFRGEFAKLLNAGGAPEPPPRLTRLAGGPMLASAAKTLRQAYELNARSIGTARLVSVEASGYSRSAVTVRTCEDGSEVRIVQGKKELGRGEIAQATYEVRRAGDSWRVWSTTQNAVKSCAGS